MSNLTLRADTNEESNIETLFNPFVPGVVEAHAALGQNVSFVDMHSVLGPSDLLDRAHPNASGNLKLGAAWAAAVEAVAAHEPGDANLDGQVDVNDLTIVLANFGQTGMFWGQGDFNGDGTVDINDLTIVLANFGASYGAGNIKAVPEPSTIAILLAGAVGLLAYAWQGRSSRRIVACLALLAVGLSTAAAHAQGSSVFNMPNGETSLQFVTVGDPGNAADGTGYGAVGYVYQMGKYDVTVGQYCQFLNAVAKTDTYGLYISNMGRDVPTFGITQSGSSGNYSYSITGSYVQGVNCPMFDITWGDAARFCNWLQNGQPTYSAGTPGEVAGSTETGAYTLNGGVTNAALWGVPRNTGATYFLPSENEWYKAAYYKRGSTNAGYWTYPTQSNVAPGNTLPDPGNSANYYIWPNSYTDPTNVLTPVGVFSASPGPYGTFDMGGDVYQWNDAIVTPDPGYNACRGIRGGAWDSPSSLLTSSSGQYELPMIENSGVGFRVASLPTGWVHPGPGDANGDGTVDINDLTIVLTNFGQIGLTWSQGNFAGDGTVDINDLTIVLANFGKTYGTGGGIASVPEPSTIALLLAGGIGLLAFVCHRKS